MDIDMGGRPAGAPPSRFARPLSSRAGAIDDMTASGRRAQVPSLSKAVSGVRKTFSEGQKVKVKRVGNPGYEDGIIYEKVSDDYYIVRMADGRIERNVSAMRIALPPDSSGGGESKISGRDGYGETKVDNTASLGPAFRMGDKVEGNYRGKGTWYPGRIVDVNPRNGAVDIKFDDGEEERAVPPERVRKQQATDIGLKSNAATLQDGDKVEADYRGKGRYYPGKIVRDRGDGTYDVDYDDGEKETRVDEKLIRPMDKTQSSHPAATDRDTWGAAAAPRTKPSKKKWKGGKVVRKYADGTYDIELAGGGLLTRVQRAVIRPLSAAHGGKTVLPHDD